MRALPVVSMLIFASACGYSEKKFLVNTTFEFCSLNEYCTESVITAACVDAIRSVDRSSCDYNPKAAKECHKALEENEATCEANLDIDTSTLVYPAICDEVWEGCGSLWEEPYPVVSE